uniref:5-formyltetrahydrofolate cyclo-ligase n=1 Tax=Sinocyclocheilus rhinocerous TaxID=307959 RepID=A0A673JPW7_9TELE
MPPLSSIKRCVRHQNAASEALLCHLCSVNLAKVNITPILQCLSPFVNICIQFQSLRMDLPINLFNECGPKSDFVFVGGLDLILMPGLGFDKKGNRLGRGKGFYDTYLERCRTHPKVKPYTIALAFKEQLCAEVPVGEHDILIDEVLYEDEE